jgi:hypothetical protein
MKKLKAGDSFVTGKPFKFKQIFDPTYLKGGKRHQGAKKNGWLKDWKEKKVFMFTWDYCGTCECMFVRCPMCGNNCCNAGFGSVTKDFKPDPTHKEWGNCPVCNLAYQFQHLAWETKAEPKPTKAQIAQGKKDSAKELDFLQA